MSEFPGQSTPSSRTSAVGRTWKLRRKMAQLADGVLDLLGDLSDIRLTSGRQAFVAKLSRSWRILCRRRHQYGPCQSPVDGVTMAGPCVPNRHPAIEEDKPIRGVQTFTPGLKRLVRKALAKAGYAVFPVRGHYLEDGLFTLHNDRFRRGPRFRNAYQRGVSASGGHDPRFEWRVHVSLWAAATALRVPGDFVECGVNAGFISSAIMSHLHWNTLNRKFYLVDTFAGPPLHQFSPEEIEHGRMAIAQNAMSAGAYVTDISRVKSNFAEWPDAVVVQGVIPDVLKTFDSFQVAFLHIDMNCAYPERAALKHFWPNLTQGGIVLLDDYSYFGHELQGEAIDDLCRKLGANVLCLPTGQGIIVK